MARLVPVILAALWITGLAGCATRIVPPAGVADPVTVYIADYGRHGTLLLPRGSGLAEYGFGHWRWFALGEDWLAKGPQVLLVPGRATLARREIPPEFAEGLRAEDLGALTLQSLSVESGRADWLLSRLDTRFDCRRGSLVHNQEYGLDFVPDPEPYWVLNSCNTKLGEWLGELGCTVRGSAMTADFRVRAPGARVD